MEKYNFKIVILFICIVALLISLLFVVYKTFFTIDVVNNKTSNFNDEVHDNISNDNEIIDVVSDDENDLNSKDNLKFTDKDIVTNETNDKPEDDSNYNEEPKNETSNDVIDENEGIIVPENEVVDEIIKEEVKSKDEMTIEEHNVILVKEIKSMYNVDVYYGSKAYYRSSVKTTDEDTEKINDMLVMINNNLKDIPFVILDALTKEIGFSIHLLKSIEGGGAGLAIFDPYDDQRFLLSIDSKFKIRLFYHEFFHLVESYLNEKTNDNPFPLWNDFNPSGFSYGTQNNFWTVYDKDIEIEESAFIRAYSKSKETEDRATLFESLMAETTKEDYMCESCILNIKAIYLDNVLTSHFGGMSDAKWRDYITR